MPFSMILMGPCGCGKTEVGTLLSKKLGVPFLEGDDYHSPENKKKMGSGIPLTNKDRLPWLETLASEVSKHKEGGCCVACSALKKSYRDVLRKGHPDLLSLQGYIRAFLAFLNKKTGLKQYKINKPEKNYEIIIDKSVQDVRPFTACAIVKNLKFDVRENQRFSRTQKSKDFCGEKIKEVIDIQEKLHSTLGRNRKKIAIGIYPLEKITLPIKKLGA